MKERGGIIKKATEGVLGALGRRMAKDPVLGPKITAAARTSAAKEALERTEPDMQQIAALRQELERRQRGQS